jgi:hypothetical protein
MAEHGDAKLTDLLQTLANCPKAHSASLHDRCKAVYEGLMGWVAPTLLRSSVLRSPLLAG